MQTGIAESFRDGTFLVTGGTGFIGKILIEKLLRTCLIKNIAIIVRNKKELSASQRTMEIYKDVVSTIFKMHIKSI